jgi:hypothetical protein
MHTPHATNVNEPSHITASVTMDGMVVRFRLRCGNCSRFVRCTDVEPLPPPAFRIICGGCHHDVLVCQVAA